MILYWDYIEKLATTEEVEHLIELIEKNCLTDANITIMKIGDFSQMQKNDLLEKLNQIRSQRSADF